MTRLAQRLAIAQRLLEVLTVTAPQAERALGGRLADGYPTGNDGQRSTSDSTATERAVFARQSDANTWSAMVTAASCVIDDLRALQRLVDQASATPASPADKQRLRCSGGMGLRGFLDWGKPECENYSAPHRHDGLCDACRVARHRWEHQPRNHRIDPKARTPLDNL